MLEHLTTELDATKKEIDRLVRNRTVFYEIMSDMVFILNNQYRIEDMNKPAMNVFGDLRGEQCFKALSKGDKPCKSNCPFNVSGIIAFDGNSIHILIIDENIHLKLIPIGGGRTQILRVNA